MAKKSFHRSDRVSAQLRRELGLIVHAAVREHGLPSVSVSDVEVARDMAHAVKMRHVPEIHFHYDDSVDRGERIDALLRESAKPEQD